MSESPCTSVCTLGAGDVCLGCHRTAGEIMWWSQMSEEQREQAVQRAKERERDGLA